MNADTLVVYVSNLLRVGHEDVVIAKKAMSAVRPDLQKVTSHVRAAGNVYVSILHDVLSAEHDDNIMLPADEITRINAFMDEIITLADEVETCESIIEHRRPTVLN